MRVRPPVARAVEGDTAVMLWPRMRVHLTAGPMAVQAIWFCDASSGTNLLALRYGCHLRLNCCDTSNLSFFDI